MFVGPVAEFTALAKPVKYACVLELGRKVREFRWKPVPAELSGPATDTDTTMHRSRGLYREIGTVLSLPFQELRLKPLFQHPASLTHSAPKLLRSSNVGRCGWCHERAVFGLCTCRVCELDLVLEAHTDAVLAAVATTHTPVFPLGTHTRSWRTFHFLYTFRFLGLMVWIGDHWNYCT